MLVNLFTMLGLIFVELLVVFAFQDYRIYYFWLMNLD